MTEEASVGAMLRAYERDLRKLLDLARDTMDDAAGESSLLAKICLEIGRFAALEHAFHLPLLRGEDDGVALADRQSRSIDALLDAGARLEQTSVDVGADGVTGALAGVTSALDGMHTPGAYADRVGGHALTSTAEPGTTHSHPSVLKRWDGAGWPRPGFTVAAYDAFLADVRRREPPVPPPA